MTLEKFCKEVVKEIESGRVTNRREIEALKKKLAKKYKLADLPLNSKILEYSSNPKVRKLLITKPTRTISGVSVVAIMAKPSPCPGECIYCPKGSEAPQSYTGYEPAALRARLNKYDPYKQVKNRLKQLQDVGHSTDKNELIIMGGTFPDLPWSYQKNFVKRAFDAFNGKKSRTLKEAQKINEKAKNRVTGLTIETRPDYVNIDRFLELGATRIELGVQSIFPDILKKIERGHELKATVDSTQNLKNAAFKVLYQVMPGLPGSNFKRDVKMFKELFKNPDFKPDMLKIYPTLVIKGTKLYDMWENGHYTAINEEYMKELLIEIYDIAPKWLRIMRVQRDIPARFIQAGPKTSNLREVIEQSGVKTKEIRFREVGHSLIKRKKEPKNVELLVEKYKASEGTEYFISAEDTKEDILLGFCRLRIIPGNTALIRELHVYGSVAPIGKLGIIQHKGWGRKLLKKAEEIAKKEGKSKMIIISGVGVREYYRKLGYKLKGPYMWKKV
ncbi:MAG: tRNA uridine(34) 5-carboxymethylaminomethyl modification radical SAM/GNAT enzyme Elp3 [Candidatus Woesearchaeota archaeon]|nr:MAG: tRNA uridine(34) 5-carboxymethylaminomethyl modification radical SAM/GNAT enzyme Elp3 [Candidatus Woesearchaeota archaeon]